MTELTKLKPFHSAVLRKVGNGPIQLVAMTDLLKCREPRIPLWRRAWAWVTGPIRARRYRKMFENGVVIVRTDKATGDNNG